MTLSIVCSFCTAKLRAPDNAVGRTFKCPKCGRELTVPGMTTSRTGQSGLPQASEAIDDVSTKRRIALADNAISESKVALGFGIASLVLSVIGMVFSIFPCVGLIAMPVSGLGLLLGIVGATFAVFRRGRGIGFPLAGSITGFVGLGIAIMWLTICSGMFSSMDKSLHDAAKQRRDAEPDAMWDHGEKAGAVQRYKTDYEGWFTAPAEKEKMLRRIVEFEMTAGNTDEVKRWIKRGLDDKLKVEYSDPATKKLFAMVKKEHEEAVAEEEGRKQRARDEAERQAAERTATREKAEAEEAARPQPSRANYNKIKRGMSVAEVQAILGPGKENASGEGILIATWQSKAGLLEIPTIISITFQNGRVESKAIAP